MAVVGSHDTPLRVAVVGAGPAGFYTAEHLQKEASLEVRVDLIERLPTPYGLVRYGVAPDHEKIRNVTRVFDRVAERAGFRFFGNVEVGKHITVEELRDHYHQVCFATGAQTDRRMGIPGEDLRRSHPATEFVAWYNGHPDFRDHRFDLSVERVAVVGVGNVAVDVARILCRTPDELATTDIADYALEALRESRVREVYMIGRRGPAQAAFTNPEVKELGELAAADLAVGPDEVALDSLSAAMVERLDDRTLRKKIDILRDFARRTSRTKPRCLTLRFLLSPTEILGSPTGEVRAMRLVRNVLQESDTGALRPRATSDVEELAVDMVFRSVGYRGVAIEGLPFDESRGTVPHRDGRAVTAETREPMRGVYVSGWIKRGPSGVIGTNKPDAAATVRTMMRDAAAGDLLHPGDDSHEAVARLIHARQPTALSYDDWTRVRDLEVDRGRGQGRPRVKFTSVDEVLSVLARR